MSEPQSLSREPQTGQTAEHRCGPNSLSDDHSELVPLLPIPNRTVKRLRADDSVDYPCESRSSSDSLTKRQRPPREGVGVWAGCSPRISLTGYSAFQIMHPAQGPSYVGSLAQLVEQRTLNPFVAGSIPARPTKYQMVSALR